MPSATSCVAVSLGRPRTFLPSDGAGQPLTTRSTTMVVARGESLHGEEDTMAEPVQFNLSPDDIPTAWYNVLPDMVGAGMPPIPPVNPGTGEPIGPDALAPLFPMSLILQEVSTEPWHDI